MNTRPIKAKGFETLNLACLNSPTSKDKTYTNKNYSSNNIYINFNPRIFPQLLPIFFNNSAKNSKGALKTHVYAIKQRV
jgi:hypothetical protein